MELFIPLLSTRKSLRPKRSLSTIYDKYKNISACCFGSVNRTVSWLCLHYLFWKCAHYHISIKNEILGKCVPDDEKRQILYIEVSCVL